MDKISFLKIMCEKYKHFRRHLEYRRHFDFSGLATNFLQKNRASSKTYQKLEHFIQRFRYQKIMNFCAKNLKY
jgi:hypothetical protein